MANSQYETRSFTAATEIDSEDPTADWLGAVHLGFLVPPASRDHQARLARWLREDDAILDAVYAPGRLPAGSAEPVATLAAYTKEVNVGAGRMLPAELIAYVTVRPTHRRRGLLRTLMEGALSRAVANGTPLAALTVSEGSIYGRFGFGPATFVQKVELDTSRGVTLARQPTGGVEIVDASFLREHAAAVFERFHGVTTGSVGRQASYPEQSIRAYSPEGDPDPAVRAAVHFDDDGSPDGYVCYRPSGWTGEPGTITVLDLVAGDSNSRLALWEFLASIDMVNRVVDARSPVDDALRWAVTNPEVVRVTGTKDSVWLRVLDPVAALQARPYAADGALVLAIEDALGHAAGTYRLTVADGRATVEKEGVDVQPDLHLDVATLSSLYLGGVDVRTLMAAGTVRSTDDDAIDRAARMLARERAPYGVTVF